MEGQSPYYVYHRNQLIIASLIILASLILTPAPPNGKCVSFLGYDLPTTCPHAVLFDSFCPGCGLTRSFVAIAHGRLDQSLAFHRLGLFIFLVVLAQIPFRLFMLLRAGNTLSRRLQMVIQVPGKVIIASLILNWVLRLFHV